MVKIPKTLTLIGMMGAGKSTIAERLAQRLDCGWADSDRVIEAETGRTIADIFAEQGEAAFRQKEAACVRQLLAQSERYGVIALGGGAFLQPEIRALCAEKAITIWLKASLEALTARLAAMRLAKDQTRPLLAGGELRPKLKELLKKREPIYAKADIVIEEDHLDNMTETILSLLREKSLL